MGMHVLICPVCSGNPSHSQEPPPRGILREAIHHIPYVYTENAAHTAGGSHGDLRRGTSAVQFPCPDSKHQCHRAQRYGSRDRLKKLWLGMSPSAKAKCWPEYKT